MLKTDLQEGLHQRLSKLMESHGFKYSRKLFEYRRTTSELGHTYRIVLNAKGWFVISTEAYLVHTRVNRVFNELLNRNHTASDPTWGFGIRDKFPGMGYQVLDSFSDEALEAQAKALQTEFETVALPFFMRHKNATDLDAVMNVRNSEGEYRTESVSRACFALIVADLFGNSAFDSIYQDYVRFLEQSQGKQLVIPIHKVYDGLRRRRLPI